MVLRGPKKYLNCPVCDAEIPVAEDDRAGSDIYCAYCQSPLKLRQAKGKEEFYLEEDF